jgi:hypothetical protein
MPASVNKKYPPQKKICVVVLAPLRRTQGSYILTKASFMLKWLIPQLRGPPGKTHSFHLQVAT